jgi:hypothetical protein
MSNHITYYNLGMASCGTSRSVNDVRIVDDLMTKLNNLTNGELVLSSVIFDVGNQDETKTAPTIANHIRAYVAPV